MSRTKLKKYNQFKTDPNCLNYEYGEDVGPKVEFIKSKSSNFKRVFVELCAGYCEYSLEYSELNPNTLCIAVDIKEDRLMYACNLAKSKGLNNILFVRTDIAYLYQIITNQVDLLYITHPDPQINKKRKRLNQPRYMEVYSNMLNDKGEMLLVTDNQDFYDEFIEQSKIKFDCIDINSPINILPTRYNLKFITESNQTKLYRVKKKEIITN